MAREGTSDDRMPLFCPRRRSRFHGDLVCRSGLGSRGRSLTEPYFCKVQGIHRYCRHFTLPIWCPKGDLKCPRRHGRCTRPHQRPCTPCKCLSPENTHRATFASVPPARTPVSRSLCVNVGPGWCVGQGAGARACVGGQMDF